MRLAPPLVLTPLFLVPLVAATASAQWQPNGVQLSDTCCAQPGVEVLSDGMGGAAFFWQDIRSGPSSGDIYAGRLLSGGYRPPGWPVDGARVSGLANQDSPAGLAPDGAGGWYAGDLAIVAGPNYEILLQHLTAGGLPQMGWPADGLLITPALQALEGSLCSDGESGVYDAWETDSTSYTAQLRMVRVHSDGTLASGWTQPGGLLVCSAPGPRVSPRAVADDSAGAFVAWIDGRNVSTNSDIFCQRFRPDGSIASGWPALGLPVSAAPNYQTEPFYVVTDHAGGMYLAWADFRYQPAGNAFNDDIFMSRVRPDGTIAAGFPLDGLPVVVKENQQFLDGIDSDAQGNAFVSWSDGRNTDPGIYLLRVNPDGTIPPGWNVNGNKVSTYPDFQLTSAVVADGSGGAFVSFSAEGAGRVLVQHVGANGLPAPGWPSDGIPVTVTPSGQDNSVICTDGAGGCIVAWTDVRLGDPIYVAQHFSALGPTPVEVSLVSAKASLGVVQLEWYAAGGNLVGPTVQRRTASSEWIALGGASVDGAGHIRYTDASAQPGERYDYRLVLGDAAASTSSEVWVEVPAAVFALGGLVPNPAMGPDLRVSFSLARSGAARIELLDVAGRRVAMDEESGLEAGPHSIQAFRQPIEPGIYWVRLSQGARTAIARGVVLR